MYLMKRRSVNSKTLIGSDIYPPKPKKIEVLTYSANCLTIYATTCKVSCLSLRIKLLFINVEELFEF